MAARSKFAAVLTLGLLLAAEPDPLAERLGRSALPADTQARVARAIEARDFPRVEALLRDAARADAAHASSLLALLGAIEFVAGRMGPAARALHDAEASGPLDARDRFTFAMSLVRLGDTAGARTQLDSLRLSHPDVPLYLYWLARIDYYQRRYEDSVQKFRQVIQLDPGSARAEDNLGLALDMLGRYEEARTAFTAAAALNRDLHPPSPWPPHNLGYLLLRLEKFSDAEAALRESLRYDPGFAQAHYHLGRVLEKEGRPSEAIEEYRQAIALDTASAEPCYSLGLLYRRLDRVPEAAAAFGEYKKRKAAAAPK